MQTVDEARRAGRLGRLFGFPDPVDEISARLVAGGVVLLTASTLLTGFAPLVVLLAYGFVARVLTGPRLSPLGLLATRVVRPRLDVPARPVPGRPKRFAQGMGAAFAGSAAVLWLGLDQQLGADLLLVALGTAASLEAAFALCLGCRVYALAARAGLVRACPDCEDLTVRAGSRL